MAFRDLPSNAVEVLRADPFGWGASATSLGLYIGLWDLYYEGVRNAIDGNFSVATIGSLALGAVNKCAVVKSEQHLISAGLNWHKLRGRIKDNGFRREDFEGSTKWWCGRQLGAVVCRAHSEESLRQYEELCEQTRPNQYFASVPNV